MTIKEINKWIIRLSVTLAALLCLLASIAIGYYATPPKVIETVTIVPQRVEVPVETIRTVITEVPVEVPVYRPVVLREFVSLDELESWLAQDNTDGLHVLFGKLDLVNMENNNLLYQDCDDYAVALQQSAALDGYYISVQFDLAEQHALNTAIIGNDIYYIEPQTDEVWFLGQCDLVANTALPEKTGNTCAQIASTFTVE